MSKSSEQADNFTRVTFRNYKALKKYSVSLASFNVLVGPNNAGKSTIVGAFRILAEGMRKAASRKPQYINHESVKANGYLVPLEGVPVATENIFTNYDDSEPATIEFSLASGNSLRLIFPEQDLCYLRCVTKGKPILSPSDFKRVYSATVGFVPVLGPVEHNEQLYQKEAARLALLTHRASRNFRNIWYHYPGDFSKFRDLIRATWPGMDIEPPEIDRSHERPVLHMFCPEERYPREIYWAGFGFQVWCQMLTYIVRASEDSLLIIDEPDIYLHSDLQRQLVEILRQRSSDVLIATHSTEIISEADPGDLLVVGKKSQSAKRIKNPAQLQSIFGALGSNLNPTLTQLAKSKRAVFVEGRDFQIFSGFARKLGKTALANRSDFAVIPARGFNPERVRNFAEGMELTLGAKILRAVIFDRDYRTDEEATEISSELSKDSALAKILSRKEIENYLLVPSVLERAAIARIDEQSKRTGKATVFDDSMKTLLSGLSDEMRHMVNAQFIGSGSKYLRRTKPNLDLTTINESLLKQFDELWSSLENRLQIVPGKELLAKLNEHLQTAYGISVSNTQILKHMKVHEIPAEMVSLVEELEDFRNGQA